MSTAKKAASFLSLIKFSHTIFAMPFALIGFLLAVHSGKAAFSWKLFGLVILCMVMARSAAMAFNRFIDREFDAKNQRTAVREIPAGVISPGAALFFVIICSAVFVAATWFINPICFYLSPVALLVVLGYSYTKRFTALCHLVLGLGLSLAPIGAWLAVTGEFAWLPLLFSFSVLGWVSGFDIIYALQDEEFDRGQGLNSIPVFFGKKGGLLVARLLHVMSAGFILFAGWYGQGGVLYWAGAACFCGLLIYQHSIVKPGDLRRVNLAFFTTNGIASVVFATFVILDLYV